MMMNLQRKRLGIMATNTSYSETTRETCSAALDEIAELTAQRDALLVFAKDFLEECDGNGLVLKPNEEYKSLEELAREAVALVPGATDGKGP